MGAGSLSKGAGGGHGSSAPPKVVSLLDAISEIQQFHVIESTGQDIDSDFLTINRVVELVKIGLLSGFKEGVLLVLIFPIVEFWLVPFTLRTDDMVVRMLFWSMPFIGLLVNTALCVYIARYYIGNITRKAINMLFVGRSMSLLVKAFLVYAVYLFAYKLATPAHIAKIASYFGQNARAFYDGFFMIRPTIMPAAMKSVIGLISAAVIPYASVLFIDLLRRYRMRDALNMRGGPRY